MSTATDAQFSVAYGAARSPEPVLVTQRATPAAAFEAARHVYLSGKRLDMRELAGELGVARTTLYRWTGGRDQLLMDVIWSLSEDLIADVWSKTSDRRGTERLLETFRQYTKVVVRSRALRAFLLNETRAALRLLTTRGSFQDRLVDIVQRIIEEEQTRGAFNPRVEPPVLAYAIVRVIEGFVYNDSIAALEPQVDTAIDIVRLILE
jgi:AcrR family transcriptional regulator